MGETHLSRLLRVGQVRFQFKGFMIPLLEAPIFNANTVNPDITQRSAAFDLGPHSFSDI